MVNESYNAKSINGDLNLLNDLTAGGDGIFNGQMRVLQDLKVGGAILSRFVHSANMGMYDTEEALQKQYPNPKIGQYALVMKEDVDDKSSLLYICKTEGKWENTNKSIINEVTYDQYKDIFENWVGEKVKVETKARKDEAKLRKEEDMALALRISEDRSQTYEFQNMSFDDSGSIVFAVHPGEEYTIDNKLGLRTVSLWTNTKPEDDGHHGNSISVNEGETATWKIEEEGTYLFAGTACSFKLANNNSTYARIQEQLKDLLYLDDFVEAISNPTYEQIAEGIFVDGAYLKVVDLDTGKVQLTWADDAKAELGRIDESQQKFDDLFGTYLTKILPTGIYTGTIKADKIIAGESGIIGIDVQSDDKTTPSWQLKADGSGELAKGAITWDKNGRITFAPGASITWKKVADLETAVNQQAAKKYTWIRYGIDKTASTGLKADPEDMKFTFIGYNKTTETPSNNIADYDQIYQFHDDTDVIEGIDGKTFYVWKKYAKEIPAGQSYPNTMFNEPVDGTAYLGLAFGKETATESSDPRDYAWIKTKGEQGAKGTSVSIKGSIQSLAELATKAKNLGDAYLFNGDLWVYTGTTTSDDKHFEGFENVGRIQGEAGKDGADGVSISSVKEQYCLYLDSSAPAEGYTGWQDNIIFYKEGVTTPENYKTTWKRLKYTMSDGSTKYSSAEKDTFLNLMGTKTTYIGETGIYSGTIAADKIIGADGTFNTALIGNLNASKITAGTMNANVSLNAKSGTIGGFTIKEGGIEYKNNGSNIYLNTGDGLVLENPDGNVQISNDGIVIYHDSELVHEFDSNGGVSIGGGKLTWDNDQQVLSVEGEITATSGKIGGWGIGIDSQKLESENSKIVLDPTNEKIVAGNITLDQNKMACTINNVESWKLNADGTGSLAKGNLTWGTEGNVELKGKITASSGQLAGWTIGSDSLVSGNEKITLKSSVAETSIEAGNSTNKVKISADGIKSVVGGQTKLEIKSDGSGSFAGGNLKWGTSGNVEMTGEITASSGTIGGFSIEQEMLTTPDGIEISSNAEEGFTASSPDGIISVNTNGLEYQKTGGTLNYIKTVGDIKLADGNFVWDSEQEKLTVEGEIKATSGTIGGWTVSSEKISRAYNSSATTGFLMELNTQGTPNINASFKRNNDIRSIVVSPGSGLTISNSTDGGETETEKTVLSMDGSGFVAGGNFSWKNDGDIEWRKPLPGINKTVITNISSPSKNENSAGFNIRYEGTNWYSCICPGEIIVNRPYDEDGNSSTFYIGANGVIKMVQDAGYKLELTVEGISFKTPDQQEKTILWQQIYNLIHPTNN